jgi:integrase
LTAADRAPPSASGFGAETTSLDGGLPAEVAATVADLVPFRYDETSAELAHREHVHPELLAALHRYLTGTRADNTLRAYRSDWARFAAWCRVQGFDALPTAPLTVAAYLVDAAETLDEGTGQPAYAPATLTRWSAAIGAVHEARGLPSPTADQMVRLTLRGIRRVRGTNSQGKTPLLLDDVKRLLAHLPPPGWPTEVARRRDRAVLLFGFAGAFRRSELVGLDVADVTLHRADGLHLRVRRSKTDPEARGQLKALPYGAHPETCPVCAYLDWREVLDTFDGNGTAAVRTLLEEPAPPNARHRCRTDATTEDLPLWRPLLRPVTRHGHLSVRRLSPAAVADLVQRYTARAGLNPQLFAGHSLRAGFVTQAARNKASTRAIMRQTGHRSPGMVDAYVREADPLEGNAVTELGL